MGLTVRQKLECRNGCDFTIYNMDMQLKCPKCIKPLTLIISRTGQPDSAWTSIQRDRFEQWYTASSGSLPGDQKEALFEAWTQALLNQ